MWGSLLPSRLGLGVGAGSRPPGVLLSPPLLPLEGLGKAEGTSACFRCLPFPPAVSVSCLPWALSVALCPRCSTWKVLPPEAVCSQPGVFPQLLPLRLLWVTRLSCTEVTFLGLPRISPQDTFGPSVPCWNQIMFGRVEGREGDCPGLPVASGRSQGFTGPFGLCQTVILSRQEVGPPPRCWAPSSLRDGFSPPALCVVETQLQQSLRCAREGDVAAVVTPTLLQTGPFSPFVFWYHSFLHKTAGGRTWLHFSPDVCATPARPL